VSIRNNTFDKILSRKIIAVLRVGDARQAEDITDVLLESGINIVEITLSVRDAVDLIERLSTRDGLLVGAGTVMSSEEAARVADAGAAFYASPVTDVAAIRTARSRDLVAMPGAFTPTEIYTAQRNGADLIKLFPMPPDGARYIRSILAPLPTLKIAPSGGVSDATAASLLNAGAAALNVGRWLTHAADGSVDVADRIAERARLLVEAVGAAMPTV
jgi:2-dehydro-3-deoxyphosphogluconate aldolase/(4S)-4-hydroxy-2-oxoglutarate aldolase